MRKETIYMLVKVEIRVPDSMSLPDAVSELSLHLYANNVNSRVRFDPVTATEIQDWKQPIEGGYVRLD